MKDILYRFGTTTQSPDVEIEDYIDVHDVYGVWVDSVDVYKIENTGNQLVTITERQGESEFQHYLIKPSKETDVEILTDNFGKLDKENECHGEYPINSWTSAVSVYSRIDIDEEEIKTLKKFYVV